MLNPHQNININISYNLGADKVGKQLPAKRINKQIKTQAPHPPNQCDIQIKLKGKNLQNNLKKSNQPKATVETKKAHRKKISNVPRNTCTPDLFNDRRIKTEGPSADHEFTSALKKQNRTKTHFKSMQQPSTKMALSTKKPVSLAKTAKALKAGHITSCTIPNWKKLPADFGQHTISQGSTSLPKKRRTQSALLKNDRVISKLLSMSILASQLGGSQPITSERRSNQSGQSRTFKEYMSSMDMRIIRCMQDDVPVFMDHSLHPPQETIRNIMRGKQISLQELTRKVVVIQRFWKRCKRRVVQQYHLLFRQIADKLNKQDKISQISGIAESPADINQEEEHNVSSLFQNEGLVSCIKRDAEGFRQNSIQSDSFDSSLHNIRWIEENQQPSGSMAEKLGGLNIKKYRELVSEEVKNNSNKSKYKEKYKEQVDQWNSINKHITSIMNHKGSIDSQILLDELIRQSKHNQYWIDNDFDHSQHRPPVPPRESDPLSYAMEHDQFIMPRDREGQAHSRERDGVVHVRDIDMDQPVMPTHNFSEISQQSQDVPNVATLSIHQKGSLNQKYEDSLDEQEQQNLYDKNKYELMSDDRVKEQQKQQLKELVQVKAKSGVMKIQIQLDKIVQANKQPEQVWISQQIMQDNVVRNYLDCGLDDFGININSRIMQLPKLAKEDGSDNDNQNQYNFSSDQAIGNKFQQANLALLKKHTHDQPDPEPHSHHIKLNSLQTDEMVEEIVKFLISEFASDISVILKKSAGPVAQKKPVAPKGQGIATNFNSIREYLKKFINFICREEINLHKIVDTINKDIGPSSLEILTYLRPEPEDAIPFAIENEEQSFDDEQGLFVIPADIFQQFQSQLQQEYRAENQKEMSQRMKAYLSFWHRCIFESYNECLDYERPYGIEGKPYQWTTESKVFRRVVRGKVMQSFEKAENRLLDLTMLVGGIIFEKNDSPFAGADLSQEQKHMMNEERLSRILATELLQSEQSWINYNDEMAELLVELSRMIEQKIFFEHGTELKKLQRRRKIIAEETATEDSVVFNLEEL